MILDLSSTLNEVLEQLFRHRDVLSFDNKWSREKYKNESYFYLKVTDAMIELVESCNKIVIEDLHDLRWARKGLAHAIELLDFMRQKARLDRLTYEGIRYKLVNKIELIDDKIDEYKNTKEHKAYCAIDKIEGIIKGLRGDGS